MTGTPDYSALVRAQTDGPKGSRPIDIDRHLLPVVSTLKRIYQNIGNPSMLYLAGYSFVNPLRGVTGTSQSFQFSQLLAFLAEMLLAEGLDAKSLQLGLQHIDEALDLLARIPIWSEEIMRAQISYALYQGVILKALGRFDESIRVMRKNRESLSLIHGATRTDLVMLIRQEVIMNQETKGFAMLADYAGEYRRSHPAEYFGTIKRIFEFALNHGRMHDLDTLYPLFRRAFRATRYKLSPLSHVSFFKNVGHYLAVARDERRGVAVLRSSLTLARSLSLRGQERQIGALLGEGAVLARRGLPVFRV
jgi:hypothetical protein